MHCVQALNADDFPGVADIIKKYAQLVKDVLLQLSGFKEFEHLVFKGTSASLEVRKQGIQMPWLDFR